MDSIKSKELLELNFSIDENGVNSQNPHSRQIKISPIGDAVGLDGRAYKIDGEILINNITKNALHIPLDVNHDFGAAVGWFDKDSFVIKEDGIYANLELNEKGEELIKNRAFRYLSPVYSVNFENRAVLGLDSVGLVNRPNLLNESLNFKGEKMEEEIKALKTQIGELNAKFDALQKDAPQKDEKDENSAKFDELNAQILELNKKLDEQSAVLKALAPKGEISEPNAKEILSDGEKKVCASLGISEDDYLKTKGE